MAASSNYCSGSPTLQSYGGANGATLTFANVNGGVNIPANTTFVLYLGNGDGISDPSPITIGGVTLTKLFSDFGGYGHISEGMYYADIGGASVTDTLVLHVTASTINYIGIECWYLTGAATGGPSATGSFASGIGGAGPTVTLSIPTNGVAVAGFYTFAGTVPLSPAATFSGSTAQDGSTASGGVCQVWAAHSTTTGSTTITGTSSSASWQYNSSNGAAAWAAVSSPLLMPKRMVMM